MGTALLLNELATDLHAQLPYTNDILRFARERSGTALIPASYNAYRRELFEDELRADFAQKMKQVIPKSTKKLLGQIAAYQSCPDIDGWAKDDFHLVAASQASLKILDAAKPEASFAVTLIPPDGFDRPMDFRRIQTHGRIALVSALNNFLRNSLSKLPVQRYVVGRRSPSAVAKPDKDMFCMHDRADLLRQMKLTDIQSPLSMAKASATDIVDLAVERLRRQTKPKAEGTTP